VPLSKKPTRQMRKKKVKTKQTILKRLWKDLRTKTGVLLQQQIL